MKNKLRLFLFLALTLLLAVSVIGCGQAYTQEDLQEAYQTGYNTGFTEGYNAGLAQSGAETVPPKLEPSQGPEIPSPPAGAISWDEAKDHIGDKTTVCGPVAGTFYGSSVKGRPTFLNIGEDYPSNKRFTVVIWGENRGNFPQSPESYYDGKAICVTGLIQEYEGIPQIEVTAPDQIQEQ